jgi:hypothetical protein
MTFWFAAVGSCASTSEALRPQTSQGKFYVSNDKVILPGAERLLKASVQVSVHFRNYGA